MAAAPVPKKDMGMETQDLVINNRVLLKVEGKPISVMDVVKKMDLLFYRQYPEYASSTAARYQYYLNSWRPMLESVIDDYLIMADSKEKKVTVNDGETRQELERLFGPDVVLNLDKAGMTFEEAFELLKRELTVDRMTSMMVHSKAIVGVHPKVMKKRYEKMREANPPLNYWVFRILSIRGEGHQNVAKEAHRLMTEQNVAFEDLISQLQAQGTEIAYSDEYRQKESDLSQNYKSVLEKLAIGGGSAPISNQRLSRLFCLKNIEKVNPPTFKETEEKIKGELMQELVGRYDEEYRKKLRAEYGLKGNYLDQLMPKGQLPFVLRG